MDKNHPGQNPPVKNLRELGQTPSKHACTCMHACTLYYYKLGGGPRCVTFFRGVPRCVTGGGGQKLSKKA